MINDFSKKLLDLTKERRSIRLFNGEKIPREEVLSIIEAGIWAPSGCNNQELRFFILDREKEISDVTEFKPFFKGVSVIVLVFCDMSLPMSRKIYEESRHGRHLRYVDTGLALGNMILYAKSKGVDSCIFNLSEYHFKRSSETHLIKRIINKIKIKLNLYTLVQNNFEFYLRNHLKIPAHLKVMCGVAFGFTKEYPDIRTAVHGGKRIAREEIDHYVMYRA